MNAKDMIRLEFRGFEFLNYFMHYSSIDEDDIMWCIGTNGIYFEELSDPYDHSYGENIPTSSIPEQVIMSFTGKEDTNGNEVWESDIIENCDTKDLQLVYWNTDKASWYCKYLSDNTRIVSLADSLGNLNTVIGNMYKNDELIKE